MAPDFEEFPKIARLSRECIITEKIDGTNAQIYIDDNGVDMLVGSRTRWITEAIDNHGFAKWCSVNREELLKLGPGRHYGEWWGSGIQRGYGLLKGEKRLSLFNTARWTRETLPNCVHVVPEIFKGGFDTLAVEYAIEKLRKDGSLAAPGFMRPEGVVIYHRAANILLKKTLEKDELPKGVTCSEPQPFF